MANIFYFKENEIVPDWIVSNGNRSYFKKDSCVIQVNGCNYLIGKCEKYFSAVESDDTLIKLNIPKDNSKIYIRKFGTPESLAGWAEDGMNIKNVLKYIGR